MIRLGHLLLALAAWLAALPASAAPTPEFEYGPRPPSHISDPASLLPPENLKEIADPLATILQKEHIDIFVVVLADLKDTPPEHIARLFAKAWSQSELNCVILHVPGNKESPWIVPAGLVTQVIPTQTLKQAVAEARRRSSIEDTETAKVRAATREAADMLRYWAGSVTAFSEKLRAEQASFNRKEMLKRRFWRLGPLAAAALIGISALVIPLLVVIVRKNRPRHFPNPAAQPRLGAPYCGGNHASITLGPLPPP